MSQTYFSKQLPDEKVARLGQLAQSKGLITFWQKGSKTKFVLPVLDFDKERGHIHLDTKDIPFPKGTRILCSFELRTMNFFMEVIANRSLVDHFVVEATGDLFKAEKRGSFRLLTFPIYEIYIELDLTEAYEGGKVIDLKSRTSQTALFRNFLKLVESREDEDKKRKVRYRVQDLSTSGLALHIGEIESELFYKDFIFKNVELQFKNETMIIPEVKVVYVVPFIGTDKNLKSYKVGMHFPNLPKQIDEQIGRKINELLREVEQNKDFEKLPR